LAACSSCELKVIHSLKWISMRSLRRVIRHQEDFLLRIAYWLMWQQAILAFGMFTSRNTEAAVVWWVPRLKTRAFAKVAVDFHFFYASYASWIKMFMVKRLDLIFVVVFMDPSLW
jgi:hypothetical protein